MKERIVKMTAKQWNDLARAEHEKRSKHNMSELFRIFCLVAGVIYLWMVVILTSGLAGIGALIIGVIVFPSIIYAGLIALMVTLVTALMVGWFCYVCYVKPYTKTEQR